MENENELYINTTAWDAGDIGNEYVIHSYGRDLDGKSVGLRISGFQPKFYIKFDDNTMKCLEKKSTFNTFKYNLDILSKKNFKCKYGDDEMDSEEREENEKNCHCLKCINIDLIDTNDEDTYYYDNNKFFFTKPKIFK